jgi:hypothetical protein
MAGTPFRSTYFWLRTMTPTTALHEHHDKKQHQSDAESFHRTTFLHMGAHSTVVQLLGWHALFVSFTRQR